MTLLHHTIPWSRRKWLALIIFSFAVHLVLIWLFGERPRPTSGAPLPFQMAMSELGGHLAAARTDFDDPVLFALPSRRGFSASGWLHHPLPNHFFHEWQDEQRWLALPTGQLGASFVQYVRSATEHPPPPSEKAQPILAMSTTDVTPDWLPGQSRVRMEGVLRSRLLHPLPTAPPWPNRDILAPSVAELLVDEKGRILTAVVIRESGNPVADARILTMIRDLSFASAPLGSGLAMGQFIVDWITVPVTNSPAAAGAP